MKEFYNFYNEDSSFHFSMLTKTYLASLLLFLCNTGILLTLSALLFVFLPKWQNNNNNNINSKLKYLLRITDSLFVVILGLNSIRLLSWYIHKSTWDDFVVITNPLNLILGMYTLCRVFCLIASTRILLTRNNNNSWGFWFDPKQFSINLPLYFSALLTSILSLTHISVFLCRLFMILFLTVGCIYERVEISYHLSFLKPIDGFISILLIDLLALPFYIILRIIILSSYKVLKWLKCINNNNNININNNNNVEDNSNNNSIISDDDIDIFNNDDAIENPFCINQNTAVERTNPNTVCSICLGNYIDGELVTFLACLHCFHTQCIQNWIVTQQQYNFNSNNNENIEVVIYPTCPHCRIAIQYCSEPVVYKSKVNIK